MTANAPQIPRETDREVGTTKKEGTAHDRASIALPPISVGGQTFVMLSRIRLPFYVPVDIARNVSVLFYQTGE